MHYLLLIDLDEDRLAADDRKPQMIEWTRRLRAEKLLVNADRLRPPATARTLRKTGGQALVTDGPFVETKEHLGGYYLVDVPDAGYADKLAAEMPVGAIATVLVRPVTSAHLIPRDGERPAAQTMLMCYGAPPKIAPTHSALRIWARLDPDAPGPIYRDRARTDDTARLPHAVALLDGDLDETLALAEIITPEGGATELRPVILY